MEELVDYTEDPHEGCQIWSSPVVDGSSNLSWSGGTLCKHTKVSSEDCGTSGLVTTVHVTDGYGSNSEAVRNIQDRDVISYVSSPQGPFVSDGISSEVHGFSAGLCSLSTGVCKQAFRDEGRSFSSGGYNAGFIGQSLGVTELCGRDSFLQVVGPNKLVGDLTAQLPTGEVFLNDVKSGAVRKRRRNCIKQRATPLNLVLGEEVKMHEVVDRAELTLVGHFPGRRMGDKGERIGCRAVGRLLLGGSWKWDSTPLWLNRWSPFFDARKERMDLMPVWVKLPGLPLEFWSLEVFKAIGNVLGHFVEADMSFITSGLMVTTHILVQMDLREGLAESLELKKGLHSLTQPLDYSSVPFRCNRCHKYGHLAAECPLPFQRKVWVRKKPQISQVSPVASLKDVIQVEDEQVVYKLSEGPVVDLSRKTTTRTNLNLVSSAGAEAYSKEDLWKIVGGEGAPVLKRCTPNIPSRLVCGLSIPRGLLEEKCSSSSGNNLSSDSEEKYMRYDLRPRKGSSTVVPECSLGGIGLNISVGPKHKGSGRNSLILLVQEKVVSDIVAGRQRSIKGVLKAMNTLERETLCVGDKILGTLESLLGGWVFICVDARGRSGGLITVFYCSNSWFFFWDKLLSKDFLRWDNIILGGDLNFPLGSSEIWGSKAQVDGLSGLFFRKLIDTGLIDIEPVKLKPTWRNKRLGDERITKRLDRFLVSESLLEDTLRLKQWVGSRGESDHFPVLLVLTEVGKRPPSRFKFNHGWLAEDDFVQLVKGLWLPFDCTLVESASIQFESKLKRIKLNSINWAHAKKIKDEKDLVEVEKSLEELYESEAEGFFAEKDKGVIFGLELRRRKLLEDKEATWRLKSRALWLSKGDENTKFFHQSDACKFEDVAKAGVEHFSSLFKAEERVSIAEVIRMAQVYPCFVNEEDNLSVMEPVSKEELLDALHSFQKDKSRQNQIHHAIGVAQEGLHSIKTRNLKVVIIKIDLSKAYDRVNWLYLRLLLTHIGFCVPFISWVMSCISTVSFSVLINGAPSNFFRISRGLRQGCPLSPLLFLIVAKGLSRALIEAKRNKSFKGVRVGDSYFLSHLLFVDDIIIFCDGSRRDLDKFRGILDLYCSATGMLLELDEGQKYLGYNTYLKQDWNWLPAKFEKRISIWCQRCLSRGGRLVLVKSVLEALPVYWMSLSWIPQGILDQMRKISFRFLWSGGKEKRGIPWVKWQRLAVPKALGGWRLKNIFLFSKALAAKSIWRLIQGKNPCCHLAHQKYISPESIEDWIRSPQKSIHNVSAIWKAAVTAFPLLGSGLVWKSLRDRGLYKLSQVSNNAHSSIWGQEWISAEALDFRDNEAIVWGTFVARLEASHVRISEKEDMLVWAKSPLGVYNPKAGYLALNARALTWDNLQKRNKAGLGRCPLCKASEESNNHIIMECNFSQQVWKEIAVLTGLKHAWSGSTVEEGLRGWCSLSWVKEFLALPVIIAWGIWLARNASIFEEIETHPLQCASQGLGILKNFPQPVSNKSPRHIIEEEVGGEGAWAFFHGAAQGIPQICGAGGVLYIDEGLSFKFRAGLGFGTNNFAKLMALKLILLLANEKGFSRLQVFGDSLNVINWMRETQN
eukprot:Gb_12932 [translate_table: standard]